MPFLALSTFEAVCRSLSLAPLPGSGGRKSSARPPLLGSHILREDVLPSLQRLPPRFWHSFFDGEDSYSDPMFVGDSH